MTAWKGAHTRLMLTGIGMAMATAINIGNPSAAEAQSNPQSPSGAAIGILNGLLTNRHGPNQAPVGQQPNAIPSPPPGFMPPAPPKDQVVSGGPVATHPLEGWGPFKFGMTPYQVREVSKFPVDSNGPYVESVVAIDETDFQVDFDFASTNRATMNFPNPNSRSSEWLLQSIQLHAPVNSMKSIGLVQPCPSRRVLAGMTQTYGQFTSSKDSDDDAEVIWDFPEGRTIKVDVFTPLGEARGCSISITYAGPKIAPPPAAPLPKAQY